jgi:hypothetical protein
VHWNHKLNEEDLLERLRRVKALPFKAVHRPMHAYTGKGHQAFITRNELCCENGEELISEETGEPKNPVDFMWHAGHVASKKFGIASVAEGIKGAEVPYPKGASVICPPDEFVKEQLQKVAEAFTILVEREWANPSMGFFRKRCPVKGKLILGYNKPADHERKDGVKYYAPTLADNLSYLSEELRDVVVAYLKGNADYIGAPYECIPDWKIIFPVYPGKESRIKVEGRSGFPPHLDGVKDFKNHPGMVFNYAFGMPFAPDGSKNYKYFDYIHLYDKSCHRSLKQIYRMQLEQGDISITSGEARINWAHGVAEQDNTQITVGIKTGPIEYKADRPAYNKIDPDCFEFGSGPVHYIDHAEALKAAATV